MDDKNKALCKLLFDQGEVYQDIADTVLKRDGKTHPTKQAVWLVINNWDQPAKPRGRPEGSRKTTAAEDERIVQEMLKIRGAHVGGAVDAKVVHDRLPPALKAKVNPQLVRLRLNEAGYEELEKVEKDPPGKKEKENRCRFGKKYAKRTPSQWRSKLQGAGDFKEYVYLIELLPYEILQNSIRENIRKQLSSVLYL